MMKQETHVERMKRLKLDGLKSCNAGHITFGGRCLNCGYTPPDFKATLIAPKLDK